MTMVACGPNKLIETQKQILTESIAKIDSVETMEAFAAFQQEFDAKLATFNTENADAIKDFKPSEEETKVLEDLRITLTTKMSDKAQTLVAAQAELQAAADSLAKADSIAMADVAKKK